MRKFFWGLLLIMIIVGFTAGGIGVGMYIERQSEEEDAVENEEEPETEDEEEMTAEEDSIEITKYKYSYKIGNVSHEISISSDVLPEGVIVSVTNNGLKFTTENDATLSIVVDESAESIGEGIGFGDSNATKIKNLIYRTSRDVGEGADISYSKLKTDCGSLATPCYSFYMSESSDTGYISASVLPSSLLADDLDKFDEIIINLEID